MNYLLGIDVGTSATKTVLFDENGRVTASASQEYPLYQPENGWAEQRPEDWADAVLNTIKEVISKSGAGKDDVKGIGISGQMHGLVMLDEMGEVIRPSIIWCDQRTGAELFTSFFVNNNRVSFTERKVDLSSYQGLVMLKARAANGTIVRLKVNK